MDDPYGFLVQVSTSQEIILQNMPMVPESERFKESGGDQVFDEITSRNEKLKMARNGNSKEEDVDLIKCNLNKNRVFDDDIVTTQVIDLTENETSGDLPIQGEMGLDESLIGNREVKNYKRISPKGDVNRGSTGRGVKEVEKIKSLSSKGIFIRACSNVPPRNQEAKIVLDEGKQPCIDEVEQNVNNHVNKAKGQNGLRKLPSSFYKERKASKREKNEGIVEKNKHNNDKSKCFPKTSKGSCSELPSSTSENPEVNQIMKNILGALELMAGKEKEKVNDVLDKEVDFLDSAIDRGTFFRQPRWWPEDFSDEETCQ